MQQDATRTRHRRAVERTPQRLRIAGRGPQRVHMSVGFAAGQHDWLRREAFAARWTPAEMVRRQVAAVAQMADGEGDGTPVPSLQRALAGAEGVTRSRGTGPWRRMTVIFGADQHDWLRHQGFLLGVPLASVVRACVDVGRCGAEPEEAAPVWTDAATPRPPSSRLRELENATHMTVGLPHELHRWLRRRAFEERTTMAELVRRHLAEARERFDGASPVSLRTH